MHEASGDLAIRDDAFRRETVQGDEVGFKCHRLVPPFQQCFRVGEFLHFGGLDVENHILADERDPRSGVLLGLHPGVGSVLAEDVGGHRDSVAEFQWSGGRRLHRLPPILVGALDEELAAERVGDLVVADLQLERPVDHREAVPLIELEQAVAVAADDNLVHAVLGERRNLHDHDLARRGVEAGLLPGVRAGGEVGRITRVGVPAMDEIRIIGDRAGDALLGFDDAWEILG